MPESRAGTGVARGSGARRTGRQGARPGGVARFHRVTPFFRVALVVRVGVAVVLAAWLLSLGRAGGPAIVSARQAAPATPAAAVAAAPASQKIVSDGPLTRIEIWPDLACAVDHAGDAAPEFYEDHACATALAVAGALYRPADLPSGESASPFTPFTPVSQSDVQGSGTATDPYRIVTVVDAGDTGLRITETDSYVVGQETYRTDVTIANRGGSGANAILYRAGDCYLQNSDQGFGSVDRLSGAVACVSGVDDGSGNPVPGPRIEQWYPLTSGSTYFHAGFDAVWAMIGTQQVFPNTCRCTEYIDNGAGIAWRAAVAAGGSGTWSQLTGFSPLGVVPLAAAVVADRPSLPASGSGTYTVTITNPNKDPATVATITVDVPAGFAYVASSTRGATTANPTVAGPRLTWAGPFTLGPSGTVSLSFTAIAGPAPGTYTFQGGGTANAPFVVAPTGQAATVTIGGNAPLPDVLPGPLDISLAPEDVARSIGITLFLMLLIAAPTPLFNNTLENNLDEIRHMLRLDRLPRTSLTKALGGGWLGLAVYLSIAALLYALLDSSFPGPDGLLLYVSGLLGLAVGNAAISLARDRYVFTRYGRHGTIKIAQWTLVLAAVCVLLTRLTGVQPGYVYGIVATVAFAVPLTRDDEGRMAWLGAVALLVMAVGAWFLRIPVQPTVGHPQQGLGLLADKALVAVFVTGVEGLVFGLIPIRFMIGEPLSAWRRLRWLALWGAGILLFAHVILYPVSDYEPNPSAVGIWTVAITVIVYSAVAIGFWWYFRERDRRRQIEGAAASVGGSGAATAVLTPESAMMGAAAPESTPRPEPGAVPVSNVVPEPLMGPVSNLGPEPLTGPEPVAAPGPLSGPEPGFTPEPTAIAEVAASPEPALPRDLPPALEPQPAPIAAPDATGTAAPALVASAPTAVAPEPVATAAPEPVARTATGPAAQPDAITSTATAWAPAPPPAAPPGWQHLPVTAPTVPPLGWPPAGTPSAWPQPGAGTPGAWPQPGAGSPGAVPQPGPYAAPAAPPWGYGPPPAAPWAGQHWAAPPGWTLSPTGQWVAPRRPAVSGAARAAAVALAILGVLWVLAAVGLYAGLQGAATDAAGNPTLRTVDLDRAALVCAALAVIGFVGIVTAVGAWQGRPVARFAGIAYGLIVGGATILIGTTSILGSPATAIMVAAWALAVAHLVVAAILAAGWHPRS